MLDNYYDAISGSYDELYHDEQMKKVALIKGNIKVREGFEVLDVGAGCGYINFAPCRCTVTRLDPSAKLLNHASGTKVVGTAEDIPFPESKFDLVVSITAAQNFSDIKKAISEMKRVSKKDAEIVISFLKKTIKRREIEDEIISTLKVRKVIEEEKDIIYFASKS